MFDEINEIQKDLPLDVKWKSDDADTDSTGILEDIEINDNDCEFHFNIRLSDMTVVTLKTNWYKLAFIDSTDTLMGCLWSIKLLRSNQDQIKCEDGKIKCLMKKAKAALSVYT